MKRVMMVCALLSIPGLPGYAAAAGEQETLNEDKPFAETHVILQVSNSDPSRHRAVLDIANNLIRHYGGPDMVDIEVVAFAGGIPVLLQEDNPNRTRISVLMDQGVRFFACGNTLDTLARRDGTRPEVLPGVQTVQTGVAFMIREMERGYLPVHP